MQFHKIYWTFLKIIIVAVVSYSIYIQLYTHRKGFAELSIWHTDFVGQNFIQLLLIIACSIGNWVIEAVKWRLLIRPIYPVSLWQSFKAVCTGITLGLFTPNRVGEFGGRVLFVPQGLRYEAVARTLAGSVAQLVASCLLGIVGYGYYLISYTELGFAFSFLIIFILFSLWTGLSLLYWEYDRNIAKFFKIKIINKWVGNFQPKINLSVQVKQKLFLLSFLRHIVFSLEYVMILYVFDVSVSGPLLFLLVLALFFVQTILPNWEFLGLAIKGKLALYFFGLVAINDWVIITSALMIWLLNLIAPAITGLLFFLEFKPSIINNESPIEVKEI